MMSTRPLIKIEPTPTDKVVEAAALVGLGFMIVTTALCWPMAPERIPTHFGFAGEVDAWGPKSTLLLLPAISAFMYTLLTVVCRFPHTFNYPVPITEQNAERQYRIALSAMRWMKLEIVWMFAYLNWQIVQVALGKAKGMDAFSMPIFVAVILGTCVVLVAKAYRAR